MQRCHRIFVRAGALAPLALALVVSLIAAPALAHEERSADGVDWEVGMINEPTFVGDRSGLEFSVMRGGQPLTGLESTLKAQATYGDSTRDLPITARDGDPGWYESVFIPTAAGGYTFHITGTIEGSVIDETFTDSPTGFGPVEEGRHNEFPAQLPAQADLVDRVAKGAKAAEQIPIALGMGAAGLVAGLIGIGLSLAGRRRRS